MTFRIKKKVFRWHPVTVERLIWSGIVKGEMCAELKCGACLNPIDDKLRFAIAWIREGSKKEGRSMRLCNSCAYKAEHELQTSTKKDLLRRVTCGDKFTTEEVNAALEGT